MLCPACRTDNFEGEDSCTNCGADLRTRDIPQPLAEQRDAVLGDRLGALAARALHVVPPTMPAGEAIALMHREEVDCLLVCEGPRLVGIFTDRDAVLKVAGMDGPAPAIGEVMTRDPVVLDREDTVAIAINKMAVGGFRHIPIVEGDDRDRPVGVVAAADLFHHLVTPRP